MIIRYALFEGTIHPGKEHAFRSYVEETLVPLWTRFPGAEEIRVLYGDERDEGAPAFAMALAIRYPDLETCHKALESDVRYESRDRSQELMTMFTGKVHHHIFKASEYSPSYYPKVEQAE